MNARGASAFVLAKVLRGQSLSSALPPYAADLNKSEKARLMDLCYGSLRWFPQIECYLQALMKKPLRPKDLEIKALLISGIYQLLNSETPAYAVVHDSVSAAESLGRPWAKSLINAVLRSFLRKKQTLSESFSDNRTFLTAHPEWILEALDEAWPEISQDIVEANNSRAPMCLRVNNKKCSRDDYINQLSEVGIKAKHTLISPDGIQLETPTDISNLPNFAEGFCSVQDEAAQLAAKLLDLRPDQSVLDACAAPGGKTAHIAETQSDLRSLLAIDKDAERLEKVKQNLVRLNLHGSALHADASKPEKWWKNNFFDRILVDAPCSGTGVIRRHPDIKLLRNDADIEKVSRLQTSLLFGLWPTLKKGGILLYSTCSVMPIENDKVISNFLQEIKSARLRPIKCDWGLETVSGRQLFPTLNGHDGFYYALLQKL